MGIPLYDITIYYDGHQNTEKSVEDEFMQTANYVTKLYHKNLSGYKPPKTSRISITMGRAIQFLKPFYHGSICVCSVIIDEEKYAQLSTQERYKFILEILHKTIMNLAEIFNWDKNVFDKSYNQVLATNFKIEKA